MTGDGGTRGGGTRGGGTQGGGTQGGGTWRPNPVSGRQTWTNSIPASWQKTRHDSAW
jgi:hypothetical protein